MNWIENKNIPLSICLTLFIVVWAELIINNLFETSIKTMLSGVILTSTILFPLILFILIIQYKSSIGFGLLLATFALSIAINGMKLPYFISEYFSENITCSCCPVCVIRRLVLMILISLLGIYFANKKAVNRLFNWNRRYTLIAVTIPIIFHLLYRVF